VRTFLGVLLALTCLGLAGCSLFGKKSAHKDAPRPFMGSEPSKSTNTTTSGGRGEVSGLVTSSRDALPGANGVLAGRVLDRFYRHSSKARIQIEDLQEIKQSEAKIAVESDEQGYFVITGLTLGHQYRLIAQSRDGGRNLSGSTVARPPLSSLTIFVNEDSSAPASAIPETTLPSRPGKDGSGGSLEAPVKAKPDDGDGSKSGRERGTSSGTSHLPDAKPGTDLTNVVDGFQTRPQGPVPVAVPGPKPIDVPPPPAWSPVAPPSRQPQSQAPPVGVAPMVHLHVPSGQVRVPSCALSGNTLYALTLPDTRDQVWDFKDFQEKRRGKLLLIDFWYTGCGYCMPAMEHLKTMHEEFAGRGLEIIGIACEREVSDERQRVTPAEQKANVVYLCNRKRIPYRILMSYGEGCPVRQQFSVSQYPALYLFDASGNQLWKCVGYDPGQLAYLRKIISQRLSTP
jgi:thiol-disulfide isomerase/thioredoxin